MPLPGPVTDLDLVPDAKSALAVVVRGDPLPQTGPTGGITLMQCSWPRRRAINDVVTDADIGTEDASSTGEGGTSGTTPDVRARLTGRRLRGRRASKVDLPRAARKTGGPQVAALDARDPTHPGHFQCAPTCASTRCPVDDVFGLVNIAPRGTQALLYTNAVASSHITVLQTAPGDDYTHRTVDVHGDVHDVFPSPDGAYAIAALAAARQDGQAGFCGGAGRCNACPPTRKPPKRPYLR